jgi:hypothetical protein
METNESKRIDQLSNEELTDKSESLKKECDQIIVDKKKNLKKILYLIIGFVSVSLILFLIMFLVGENIGVLFGFIWVFMFIGLFGAIMKISQEDSRIGTGLFNTNKLLTETYFELNKRGILNQTDKEVFIKHHGKLGFRYWFMLVFSGYIVLVSLIGFIASIVEKEWGYAIAGLVFLLLSVPFYFGAQKIKKNKLKLRNFE